MNGLSVIGAVRAVSYSRGLRAPAGTAGWGIGPLGFTSGWRTVRKIPVFCPAELPPMPLMAVDFAITCSFVRPILFRATQVGVASDRRPQPWQLGLCETNCGGADVEDIQGDLCFVAGRPDLRHRIGLGPSERSNLAIDDGERPGGRTEGLRSCGAISSTRREPLGVAATRTERHQRVCGYVLRRRTY
jgi:hypothetical protein